MGDSEHRADPDTCHSQDQTLSPDEGKCPATSESEEHQELVGGETASQKYSAPRGKSRIVNFFKSEDAARNAMAGANQSEVLQKASQTERKLRSENTILQEKVNELRATIIALTANHKQELRNAAPKLRKELSAVIQEVEASRKLVGSLLEEQEALRTKYSDLEDTENMLRKTFEKARLKSTQQTGMLLEEKDRLGRLNEYLTREQANLTDQVRRLRAQCEEKDDRIDILLVEIEQAKAEIVSVREDNELIRAQIYNTDRAVGPKNSEEHYIRSFQELSGDFENWVVRNSRAEKQQKLTKEDEVNLLALLSELGVYGQETSKFLGSNGILKEWYSKSRSRIVLIRHIAAMFIYAQIFEPTVLGLPPDAVKLLRVMEHNILTQDNSFGNSLKTRQQLIREAAQYAHDNLPTYKSTILSRISKLFQLLLPTSPPHEMRRMQIILENATSLKLDMTEENIMYHCYWTGRGEEFNTESMQTRLEETGPVSVCTFPGLAKSVERNGTRSIVYAITAQVVLQGQAL